ncbi:alpha/beta fold hydrolase [Clostridium vincentii]|uniref:2-succinyl-6-hydroxy-2, 4-cyclohexadiene-1-carboxylate synthase n=1 Tax=Clostridium vincentii TaxID=52704 RepID=A0A2T0B524_9CLOT|nr:alpha/beta hydrolase [Clostridium vincentii]PRR79001.1 2-succinyl-6-hydroxy-2,4-cyclohexadiene-1-carboxylate synthase [Clostridium vincentii]
MRFIEYGNNKNKLLIFINGTLMPWQMWTPQIQYFSKDYFVIIPVLDGHDTETKSIFTTVEKSAADIEEYCIVNYGANIYAVCGSSMGGVIASILVSNNVLQFQKVILESAPLVPMNKLAICFWKISQVNQVRNIKKRNPKTLKQYKNMYPDNLFDDVLNTIDVIDEKTVSNFCNSTFKYQMPNNINTDNVKIAYWHGTTSMEMLSKNSAKFLKKNYPQIEIKAFENYNHCELSVNHPEQYIEEVEKIL